MPTVEQNKQFWTQWDWKDGGHEWSTLWGTAADQWAGTIYPRIFSLLPAPSILEIAPGYGRWTPYLLNNTDRYIGVDVSEPCIEHCRRVFGPLRSKPAFLLGDGYNFAGVPDGVISFVFSFDSLVHVEIDCILAYAAEIYRVLAPGGHAFIHHSNTGEYVKDGISTIAEDGMRGHTVTAEAASATFRSAGLIPVAHEKIKWTLDHYVDCFSLIYKPRPGVQEMPASCLEDSIFYNDKFDEEIKRSKMLSTRYTRHGP